jgi:hypothetical protein
MTILATLYAIVNHYLGKEVKNIMNNKTKLVELTRQELLGLEEWLGDNLREDPLDEETQGLYLKIRVALGEDRCEVENEINEWVSNEKQDKAYEEELAKLHEKYYPEEKAA